MIEAPDAWELWQLFDLARLAGVRSVDSMAQWFGKTPEQVDEAAYRLGLDVSMECQDLLWCDECATWRTELNESGRCKVCNERAKTERERQWIAELFEAMPPDARKPYELRDSRRGMARRVEGRPRLVVPEGASSHERAVLEAVHLAEIEGWEFRAAKREYDAVKQLLHRLRVTMGIAPRGKREAS
ncbi:Uncharacterised protein [Slackia heliotrinireducens]|uniref:Uncharacterized protein n=1 Tax=Slackia heliotrinireducens (strain ATCC 29202 / DSM 20476 / NCTC 11029 / RHS 1) TaxID=471855 RepID=C7N3C3_SLAHD|nr:hypothetical protein [Slackia heliotrinireducens]ACV23646.1 hypothetical protein Shel_26440 [Slackia heliotrinireducens DSM 20476]VEH03160.1 Uncharacterised protein [Slackia heliotrinireducens]